MTEQSESQHVQPESRPTTNNLNNYVATDFEDDGDAAFEDGDDDCWGDANDLCYNDLSFWKCFECSFLSV